MSAQLLSFTTTMTERDVQRGMASAMLALVTERDDALDLETVELLARQLTTMAAAYADLAAQLGIAPPRGVEAALSGLPIA